MSVEPGKNLGSGFASRRYAACLLTPLRWNDAVGIDPHEGLMNQVFFASIS